MNVPGVIDDLVILSGSRCVLAFETELNVLHKVAQTIMIRILPLSSDRDARKVVLRWT